MRLTSLQISQQSARFEAFLLTANLSKIAKTWLDLNAISRERYIHLVLLRCANVDSNSYSPIAATSKYYSQILVVNALSALINKTTGLIAVA